MEGNESNILTTVTFKNSKRIRASRFMVTKFINLHDLENEIKIRHPEYSRERFEITYKDSENSENNDVVIACDDDLKLMFVGREEGILKLNVQGRTGIQNETKRGFLACLRKFFCCGLCSDKASTADEETANVRNSITTLPKSREDLENIEQGQAQEQEQEQEKEKEQKQEKEKEPEQQQEQEQEQKQEQKKEPEQEQGSEQEQEQKQEKGKEQQEQNQEHEHGQEKEGRPKEQVLPSMFQLVSPSRKLTETSLKSAEVFDDLDEIEKRKFLVQEETNQRRPSLKVTINEETLYNRQGINEQVKISQKTGRSANVEKGLMFFHDHEHEHRQEKKEEQPKQQVPPSMFKLLSPYTELTDTSLKSVFDNLNEIENRKSLVQEETNKRLTPLKGTIIEETSYNHQGINEQGKIAQKTDQQSANVEKGFSIANKSLVYIAPLSGKRYHSAPTCWGLRNANSIQQISFENIDFRTPCLICYRSFTPLLQEINNSPGPLFSMKQRDRVQAKQSVYIAPYSGQKYHSNPHCGGLARALSVEQISIDDVGFRTPCLRCW